MMNVVSFQIKVKQNIGDIKLHRKMKLIQYVSNNRNMVTYGYKAYGGNLMENLLTENIHTKDHVSDWKEAIRVAALPLLHKGNISENYIDAMIANVVENGPYIVIMPRVAMPHARVEEGSYKTGTSVLKLRDGVMFPQDKEVQLIIVLSAKDNDAHMQLLSDMVDVFMDEDKMAALLACNDVDTIRELLS